MILYIDWVYMYIGTFANLFNIIENVHPMMLSYVYDQALTKRT